MTCRKSAAGCAPRDGAWPIREAFCRDGARCAPLSRPRQPVLQVADDVLDVLQPDGEPYHVRPGAGRNLLCIRELAVRGGRRMDDQRARVADVGEMREQLDVGDQLHARLVAALEAEGEDRAGAL